jgi:hypothetical protein
MGLGTKGKGKGTKGKGTKGKGTKGKGTKGTKGKRKGSGQQRGEFDDRSFTLYKCYVHVLYWYRGEFVEDFFFFFKFFDKFAIDSDSSVTNLLEM